MTRTTPWLPCHWEANAVRQDIHKGLAVLRIGHLDGMWPTKTTNPPRDFSVKNTCRAFLVSLSNMRKLKKGPFILMYQTNLDLSVGHWKLWNSYDRNLEVRSTSKAWQMVSRSWFRFRPAKNPKTKHLRWQDPLLILALPGRSFRHLQLFSGKYCRRVILKKVSSRCEWCVFLQYMCIYIYTIRQLILYIYPSI